MDQEKRRHRQLKRDIKKAGNRKRRQYLKRNLRADPEGAPAAEFDYGRTSSEGLNGNDRDATRLREGEGEDEDRTEARDEEE